MKFINCSICLALSSAIVLRMSANGSYTRGLIKYLRKESKLHQVMFITDERMLPNSSSSINFLVTDVSQHFPTLSTSLARMQFDFQKHLSSSLQVPRRTTLFIMMLDGNQNDTWVYVYKALMELKQLSQRHSYPRCLINLYSQAKSQLIKEILEYFWSQDFLDLSVLEHLEENQKPLELEKGRLPILHEFNPFAKIYSAREVMAQTKWFPDKLRNLHGYQIKFLLTTFNGSMKKVYFIQLIEFARLLTKSMHSSTKIQNIATTEFRQIWNVLIGQKTEMLLNIMLMERNNKTLSYPQIRILGFSSIKAIIPNRSRFSKVFVISHEFIYMIVATTVAIAAIRITAWIMKFNRSTWQIFNLSQIVMGMSIVREPEKLAERIVFGALMLSCIVYSGYFFSVILDITFRPEKHISSLEELANSSLKPMIDSFVNYSLTASSITHIQKLSKKSMNVPGKGTINECLTYLTKYGNVTCIFDNAEKEVNILMTKLIYELDVKILQEPLVNYMNSFVTRSGSPFVDCFNKVILRAFDYGFLTKILDFGIKSLKKVSSPEQIEKEKLLLIARHVLIIGYTLAIVTFIAEVVSVIIWRKLSFLCRKCFNFTKK